MPPRRLLPQTFFLLETSPWERRRLAQCRIIFANCIANPIICRHVGRLSRADTARSAKRDLRLILVVFHFQVAVPLPWLFMLWPYGSGEPAPHEIKQIICGMRRLAGNSLAKIGVSIKAVLMKIIKVRFLIRLAAETAALPRKPEVLGGSFRGA
jgi:hypothetical protein